MLQCSAVCCSAFELQEKFVQRSSKGLADRRDDVKESLQVWCSVLQCVAVCWSVLQFVAVCCNAFEIQEKYVLRTFEDLAGLRDDMEERL